MSATTRKTDRIDRNTEALLTGIARFIGEELDKAKAQLRAELAVLRADLASTRSELAAVRAEVAAQRSAGIASPARRLAHTFNPAIAPRF